MILHLGIVAYFRLFLLDDKPIEYVAMALSGELQAYCDIETDMVKGMFGTIVQG